MVLYGKVATNIVKEGIISGPKSKNIGLQWPSSRSSSTPYFSQSTGYSLIKDQVTQFILTKKGERLMLPDFGTTLMNFVFEPFTNVLAGILATEIKGGLVRYAPNIKVNRIRFFQSDNLHGFGMPGIEVQVSVSPVKSTNIINIKVKL